MAADGMEIGSHGLTHRYLPLLSKKEIERELKGSKREIEALINRRVEYFAYPGGHYDRLTLKLLADNGYAGACSCHLGLNTSGTNTFLMKRMEIRKRVDMRDFGRIMANRSLRFYQMVDMGKAALRSAVGLKRYVSLREKLYKFYIFKR
jgi:peptidoglycan/xylan/chitin deacetylase (PgdA/CDA1 family)